MDHRQLPEPQIPSSATVLLVLSGLVLVAEVIWAIMPGYQKDDIKLGGLICVLSMLGFRSVLVSLARAAHWSEQVARMMHADRLKIAMAEERAARAAAAAQGPGQPAPAEDSVTPPAYNVGSDSSFGIAIWVCLAAALFIGILFFRSR